MRFFSSLYKSTHDLTWLKEQKNKTGAAWGYFFLFVLLLSALTVLPIVVSLPLGIKVVREKITQLPDFEAKVTSGTLHVTGLTQPYVFKQDDFVVVVDTVTTSSLELKEYLEARQSGVLVTKDRFEFYNDQKGESRTQYFKDVNELSFNKADVQGVAKKLLSPVTITIVVLLLVLFFYLILLVAKLYSVVLVAFLVFIVCKIAKRPWQFRELFVMGLFATTLPSVLSMIFNLFALPIPYVHFLALLAFMVAAVFTSDKAPEAVEPKI